MMGIGPFYRGRPASRWGYRTACRWGLLGAWLLALAALCLAGGAGQARAADSGTLAFVAPVVDGVVSGPPGTKVTVHGESWLSFDNVRLSLSNQPGDCTSAVTIGTYGTDTSGAFTIFFTWPSSVNQPGTYYLCGTQVSTGAVKIADNTFMLLSNAPASVTVSATEIMAGDTVTLTGSNWLPGPQTVDIVLALCNTGCVQPQAGKVTVQSTKEGTFSQQITISPGTSPGSYYVQATNDTGTLTAVGGPIQVAGAAVSNASPTPVITSTVENAGNDSSGGLLSSDNKSALKYALVAAVGGVLALLVLIGGVALLMSRMRSGADLSEFGKVRNQKSPPGARRYEADRRPRQESFRSPVPPPRGQAAPPAGRAQARAESGAASAAPAEGAFDDEYYPWERRRNVPFVLPPAPGRGPSPEEQGKPPDD